MSITDHFEGMLDKQCKNLHQLNVATALIKCKDSTKSELVEIRSELCHLKRRMTEMRRILDRMVVENAKCCEIMSLLELLDDKMVHMDNNVPQKLIHDYQYINTESIQSYNGQISDIKTPHVIAYNDIDKETTSTEKNTGYHKTGFKDCKKILFNEPEVCAYIPLLTEEEFSKLPKYIIGRQSLDTVNSLVNTINQILKSKYSLLSLGKNEARKKGELDLYLHYKKQQTTVCEGAEHMYFFNAEDYQRITKLKLDKTKLNLLTALRHCKRLREFRQGKDLQYVVITN